LQVFRIARKLAAVLGGPGIPTYLYTDRVGTSGFLLKYIPQVIEGPNGLIKPFLDFFGLNEILAGINSTQGRSYKKSIANC
jgi:hypothetical protein